MPKHYPTVAEKREVSRAKMANSCASIGPHIRFKPMANGMAAGPCEHCLAIAKLTYTLEYVPLMPLDDCPHPDQCTGIYKIDTDSLFEG